MKAAIVLGSSVVAGCAILAGQPQLLGEMLARADHYDGHEVRVCGWFVSDMETCTLSVTPDSARPDIGMIVWVAPRSDICMPINALQHPRATWAIVDGTFHTGGAYGHLGMYRHVLFGGTVTPIRNACVESGHGR
jgi:hypothetical protein